jgi:hypothetical protein
VWYFQPVEVGPFIRAELSPEPHWLIHIHDCDTTHDQYKEAFRQAEMLLPQSPRVKILCFETRELLWDSMSPLLGIIPNYPGSLDPAYVPGYVPDTSPFRAIQ